MSIELPQEQELRQAVVASPEIILHRNDMRVVQRHHSAGTAYESRIIDEFVSLDTTIITTVTQTELEGSHEDIDKKLAEVDVYEHTRSFIKNATAEAESSAKKIKEVALDDHDRTISGRSRIIACMAFVSGGFATAAGFSAFDAFKEGLDTQTVIPTIALAISSFAFAAFSKTGSSREYMHDRLLDEKIHILEERQRAVGKITLIKTVLEKQKQNKVVK